MVLEVKSIMYDKGSAASELINKDEYDFVLAIGDDRTDEDFTSPGGQRKAL